MSAVPFLSVQAASGPVVRAVSVRFLIPWKGVWLADVEIDPEVVTASSLPTGRVTLTVGAQVLTGTVDPRGSGRFVHTAKLRILGGGAGWDKPVTGQHFHADNGVSSTRVLSATAKQVGENVNDVTPVTLGIDWVRPVGPASRVFGDRDWYVDLAGVTQYASRPPATPDATFEVLDFDPRRQVLHATSDVVLLPGLQVADASKTPRWDGTLTVRDVEQVFDRKGSRATLWCSTVGVSRLTAALTSMVRELSGAAKLRVYRYRFVTATGGRLNLQAVDKSLGIPDILPVSVWPGMAGASGKYAPGQQCLVRFLGDDYSEPAVVGFDGNLPLEASLDAQDKVHIAPSGSHPGPIAREGDAVSVFFPPTVPVVGTVSGAPFTGVITIVGPAPGVIVAGSGKADCG